MKFESPLTRLVARVTLALWLAFTFTGCQTATPREPRISADQLGEAYTLARGTVEKVRDIVVEGNATALGRKGALVGAAAGSGFGGDFTSSAIAVTSGLILGEWLGSRVEKQLTRLRAQELTIRLETGATLVITQVTPPGFSAGDDVEVLERPNGKRVVVH